MGPRRLRLSVRPHEMCAMKPSIFLGSSGQALLVARAVQAVLARDADVTLWNQGVFPLSSITVQQLLKATRSHDYAMFVLADDDLAIVKGELHKITRDNVLFDLGMSIAAVGLERTFLMVSNASPNFHLPTDLAGLTVAGYDPSSHGGNLRAAVGAAWGDENPGRLTMEGYPIFVPFQKAVFGVLVDQEGQDKGTKTATFAPEKLS